MEEVATAKHHGALAALGAAVGIAALVGAAVLLGVNVFVRVAYAPFYERAQAVFPLPGLAQGFVPQDLDHVELTDEWLFSGYQADGSASPLFRRSANGQVVRLALQFPDGTPYDGHGSAVTSDDAHVFVACEGGCLAFALEDVVSAGEGDAVRARGRVQLDVTPAFMNIEEGTLYAGNFYFPEKYETPLEHRIFTSEGTENPAVMFAYPPSDAVPFGYATAPERVYSIPAMVQGMCITDDNQLVLSTSYGLRSSCLLFYDVDRIAQGGMFTAAGGEEVPLLILDTRSLVGELESPPMSEGIEFYRGRIYLAEESASNKYIFGKLYGAGAVYAVETSGN